MGHVASIQIHSKYRSMKVLELFMQTAQRIFDAVFPGVLKPHDLRSTIQEFDSQRLDVSCITSDEDRDPMHAGA